MVRVRPIAEREHEEPTVLPHFEDFTQSFACHCFIAPWTYSFSHHLVSKKNGLLSNRSVKFREGFSWHPWFKDEASLLWALLAILGTELDLHRRLEDGAWGIFSASHRLHGPSACWETSVAMVLGGDQGGGVPKHQDVETIRNYEAILLFQLWIAIFFGTQNLSSWHGCLESKQPQSSKWEENYVLHWGSKRMACCPQKGRERLGHEFDSRMQIHSSWAPSFFRMAFWEKICWRISGQSQGNVFLCLLPSPYCFHSFALSSVKNDESSNQTIQGSLEGESDIKIKSDQRLSQGSQLLNSKMSCHGFSVIA